MTSPSAKSFLGFFRRQPWMVIGLVLSMFVSVYTLLTLQWWQLHFSEQTSHTVQQATQAQQQQVLQLQQQELTTASKLALAESKLAEISLQRSQLEDLVQNLTRSRDENLLADVETNLRFSLQQSQLTGSVSPLLAALQLSQQRLDRVSQPRLAAVQRALAKDLDQMRSRNYADLPNLLIKLDELVVLADSLQLVNAQSVPSQEQASSAKPDAPANADPAKPAKPIASWWEQTWQTVWTKAQDQLHDLVRLQRIEHPEAALLAPEQGYFVRENFKLRLLNARLALLARQTDVARSDLLAAQSMQQHYFETGSRKSVLVRDGLQQLLTQSQNLQLPRIDGTLAAITAALSGR